MKKKITNLVLGSSGFVGWSLTQYLRDKGEIVIEYDIEKDKEKDCRCRKLPLEGVDRVYFLAWRVGGSNYLYDPLTQEEQLNWNVRILLNVMEQLAGVGTPFVFVSSQLAENCNTVYGVLKRLGELWTEIIGGVTVRLWNVYGAYEDSTIKSHVIADFIHQAFNTGRIKMLTQGDEKRQFIHIDDVCDFLYNSFGNTGIYDATSLKWASIYEIANYVAKYTGAEVIRGNERGYSLDVPNKGLVPGCQTSIPLSKGIERTVNLYRYSR